MSNHPIIAALKAKLESERNTEAVNHEESLSDEYMEETSPLEMVQSAYKSGHEAASTRLLSIIEKAVEMAEFYGNKDNWTINEDYDGYINEGWIISEDIEYPPKIPNTFSGYGYGGKKAREFLTTLADASGEIKNEAGDE